MDADAPDKTEPESGATSADLLAAARTAAEELASLKPDFPFGDSDLDSAWDVSSRAQKIGAKLAAAIAAEVATNEKTTVGDERHECRCHRITIGTQVTRARNLNPDCPVHGEAARAAEDQLFGRGSDTTEAPDKEQSDE